MRVCPQSGGELQIQGAGWLPPEAQDELPVRGFWHMCGVLARDTPPSFCLHGTPQLHLSSEEDPATWPGHPPQYGLMLTNSICNLPEVILSDRAGLQH